MQTIKFDLDRKGGKIISEAGMMVQKQSVEYEPEEKREFFLDDTFALFLIESGKDTPPLAALTQIIVDFFMGMNTGSKFILGFLMGCMTGFDMGGPVNKICLM